MAKKNHIPAKIGSANQRPSSPSPATQQQHPTQPQHLPSSGISQQAHWSGPYPPPDAVERHEAVLPGAFNRIIAMAEQLQSAQIAQSQKALEYSYLNGRRGHWLGFAITVLAFGGAFFCAWISSPWVAGAFLSIPVMAVAKALIDAAKAPKR